MTRFLLKRYELALGTLNVPTVYLRTQWSFFGTDTQRGVLTGLSRERNLRSKI